jgi:O-antigen/teichoic acid export membrane protein
MKTGINTRIAIGAGWMISLRWTDRLVALLSIAILARLLLPADFGLVGYAMVFLGTLDQLSKFNFQTVLIRDQGVSRESYDTVWTLEIVKGIVLSLILIVFAKPAAIFFGEPEVQNILYWTAVIPILRGTVNVGVVDFQKNLEFHKDFIINVVAKLFATFTTIGLAIVLRNYWALVIGGILQPLTRIALSYCMSSFRPRLCLSESPRMIAFSKWLLLQNIFASFNIQLPALVIGRSFEAQALAYFNIAKELTSMTTAQFAAPIRHALYPGIVKMQDELPQMARTVTSSIGMIVLVGLPAAIGLAVTAPLIVPVVLGDKWLDIVPIVGLLSLSTAIHMFYPNSHLIFFALNRPKITAYISLTRLCLLVPTILLVVPSHGAVGAAYSILTVNAIVTIVDYIVLLRLTLIKFSNVLAVVWRSAVAVILMSVCVTMTMRVPLPPHFPAYKFLLLLLSIAAGVVSYTTTVIVLWWLNGFPQGPEAYIARMLKRLFERHRTTV